MPEGVGTYTTRKGTQSYTYRVNCWDVYHNEHVLTMIAEKKRDGSLPPDYPQSLTFPDGRQLQIARTPS